MNGLQAYLTNRFEPWCRDQDWPSQVRYVLRELADGSPDDRDADGCVLRQHYLLLRLLCVLQQHTGLTFFECLDVLKECRDDLKQHDPARKSGFVLLILDSSLVTWTGRAKFFVPKTGEHFGGIDFTPTITVSIGVDSLVREYNDDYRSNQKATA